MIEPRWVTLGQVVALQMRELSVFGGAAGTRDPGALESAINRPINRWRYESPDLAELAAAYAFGIARNHPFIDGNKRAAFLTMAAFLIKNDLMFAPEPDDATAAILALAAGELDEDGLARWIRDNIRA